MAFEIGAGDWEKAFISLYFAAAGNNSMAQMALGYRHMYGLGVPKNCSTSVLYYREVANTVVSQAQHTTLIPQVSSRLPQVELGKANGKAILLRQYPGQ